MTFLSIAFCLLLKTSLGIYLHNENISKLWDVENLIINFALLFAGYPLTERMGINNPVWYIGILIQCFALYYLIEWAFQKAKIRRESLLKMLVYLVGIILFFTLYQLKILNEASFRGTASFFIGVLICEINQGLRSKLIINEKNKKSICLELLMSSALSCGGIFLGIKQRWVFQFMVFPLLVWGIANLKITDCKEISNLGDISFEVYLFHYPVMVLFNLVLSIAGVSFKHTFLSMVMFLMFSWIIAWILWKYIDLPIQKIVKDFEKQT